jgi:CRP/FNR family cyclic AMP-dependent transcriptional regulator
MSSEPFGELDDIGFLRDADLFSEMPEPVIRAILVQGQTASYDAGEVVVRKGEPGSSLYVVKSGVVEVVDPKDAREPTLTLLGRGECFGELALLTDTERHADVRVPQHAELLVIDKDLFEDLMITHPGFGRQLCVILARRLIKTLQRSPDEGVRKQLQGNLRYFDLATVMQTLITSNQSGVMSFSTGSGAVAKLYFQSGNIFRARYGHRTGDEAVHHLFQVQPEGEFQFSSDDRIPLTERPDHGITVPAMALMMESVRLQDELSVLRQQLPGGATRLQRAAPELRWEGAEGAEEALSVWSRLEQPASVDEVLDSVPACHFHSARVLLRLMEAKQVAWTG